MTELQSVPKDLRTVLQRVIRKESTTDEAREQFEAAVRGGSHDLGAIRAAITKAVEKGLIPFDTALELVPQSKAGGISVKYNPNAYHGVGCFTVRIPGVRIPNAEGKPYVPVVNIVPPLLDALLDEQTANKVREKRDAALKSSAKQRLKDAQPAAAS